MSTVPVVGQTFSFDIQLRSQADANLFQTNPTLDAANDFRITINGGAYDTLDNAPTVSPAGGDQVVIVVSAAETTAAGVGGRIKVDWLDDADDEWYPDYACLRVHATDLDSLATAVALVIAQADLDNPSQYKADVSALALQASVDDLESRLTATRAGYLDNLTNLDAAVSSRATVGAAMTLTAGTLTAIAAAIWNRLTTALTTAGSIGKLLVDKMALITAGGIQVTGPVVAGGNVVTYRGDSYQNVDGRALDWESTGWPDLTGATVAVIIDRMASLPGTVVTPTGTAKVRLELAGTQSADIESGRHNFQVVARKAGKDYTLIAAAWVSRQRAGV